MLHCFLGIAPRRNRPFTFPKDFLWGAASSSHQVEGGNTNNDWYEWEQLGRTKDKSGIATDHLNRYNEDFDIAQKLNHNTHRISLEWSRIEPKQGEFSEDAVQHYRNVLQSARNHGFKTFVTLHHFTNPLWMVRKGGWLNPESIAWFERYTAVAAQKFGDLVDFWMTFNEPNIFIIMGYAIGQMPPGLKDISSAEKALAHVLKAHAASYHSIHKFNPGAKVGFAHHMRSFTAHRWWHIGDKMVRDYVDMFWNRQIPLAMKTGEIYIYLPFMIEYWEKWRPLRNTLDFIGINYYSRDIVKIDLSTNERFAIVPNKDAAKSDMGWEIFPDSLYEMIRLAASYGVPVYITENGLADANDLQRKQFLCSHIKVIKEAIEDGYDVRGYLHWALTDNFEWLEGYWPRFGLVEMDYNTLERKIRPSAKTYADIITSASLKPCE